MRVNLPQPLAYAMRAVAKHRLDEVERRERVIGPVDDGGAQAQIVEHKQQMRDIIEAIDQALRR